MSFFEAYAASDSAAHWSGDLVARINDFLNRRVSPVGEKLQAALRQAEGSLSMSRVRAALRVLTARLRRQAQDPAVDAGLEAYFTRIRSHGKGRTIEDYSTYLISLDFDI